MVKLNSFDFAMDIAIWHMKSAGVIDSRNLSGTENILEYHTVDYILWNFIQKNCRR